MKIIQEFDDGFRWIDGDTSSAPFEKDSDQYKDLTRKGCKVELIPEAEKTAQKKAQSEAVIIQKLTALDLPPHTLAMAIAGDSEALDKLAKAESIKAVLREELAVIKR